MKPDVKLVDLVRLRLTRWGTVTRQLPFLLGGPAKNPYSRQPWTQARVDHDTISRRIEFGRRFDEALETDEWLNELREKQPKHYIAAIIEYVLYPRGRCGKEKLAEWKKETGLGQTRFYQCLSSVHEQYGKRLLEDGWTV